MMSREITLWLDERWCKALEKHLPNGSIEDTLNAHLDNLINQLPTDVYEKISTEIQKEDMLSAQKREAAKKYAVFRISEHGKVQHLQVERGLEFLDAARLLRTYLRGERGADAFSQMLHEAQEISLSEFNWMENLRMENSGKVTGAFMLDFGHQQFSALNIMEGWQMFNMQDVSTAVYHADRKQWLSSEKRWEIFLDKLDSKALTADKVQQDIYLEGSQRLRPEEIRFEDEIQWNNHLLEFYVPVYFDPDKVFGTEIATSERDDYVNVYAFYDLKDQNVCDELTVILYHSDGSEAEYKYKLTEEEQNLFREKMDAYASQTAGMSLAEWHEEYLAEQEQEQTICSQQM